MGRFFWLIPSPEESSVVAGITRATRSFPVNRTFNYIVLSFVV